jgi:hypothetical protein
LASLLKDSFCFRERKKEKKAEELRLKQEKEDKLRADEEARR